MLPPLLLCATHALVAVSFAPGVLGPSGARAATAVLKTLRADGVSHLAAVPTVGSTQTEPLPGLEIILPGDSIVEADLLATE
eukprot:6612946-Prymnesium_polylepis.1